MGLGLGEAAKQAQAQRVQGTITSVTRDSTAADEAEDCVPAQVPYVLFFSDNPPPPPRPARAFIFLNIEN